MRSSRATRICQSGQRAAFRLRSAVEARNFPPILMIRRLLFLGFLLPLPALAADAPDVAPIKKWIAGQDDIRTVQADFTQTRTYRALRDPLAAKGRMLFSAPGNLRWEVGEPPKMVFLRKGDAALLIQPEKKRAQRLPVDAKLGANRQAMALPTFPLAKDFASFTRQFEVLAVTTAADHCHFEILPRDPQAQKYLAAIKVDFEIGSGQLTAFEVDLRDGATMRNEFSNVRLNQKIAPAAFDYDLSGLEVVESKP